MQKTMVRNVAMQTQMMRQPSQAEEDKALVCKAVFRAARILGLTNTVLAKVLGLSESQLSRLDNGKAVLDGKAFELALLVIRLFRGLAGIVGSDDGAAQSWMRADNRALRGRPVELILSIPGLVDVVTYVDSRRARI